MGILVDSHVLLWWFSESTRIRPAARQALLDPTSEIYVSVVSAWELAIKVGSGKLDIPAELATWLPAKLEENHFVPLSVTLPHTLVVEHLPRHHADPFDRLLIAQAIVEGHTIVTSDAQFARYDVPLIRA